jgi:hypothetical protein
MGLFDNPAKDAKKIQDQIDYRVLKAAWDSYAQINIGSRAHTHKVATPAWNALFSIQNYQGDFTKFDADDLHLLKSITTVQETYDEIIKALESQNDNEELARHILTTNPALQQAVPQSVDNVEKINAYIVSVIKKYKQLLSDYYKKYQSKIDPVVKRLEGSGKL